jgi:hypothetical protein
MAAVKAETGAWRWRAAYRCDQENRFAARLSEEDTENNTTLTIPPQRSKQP